MNDRAEHLTEGHAAHWAPAAEYIEEHVQTRTDALLAA